MIKNLLNLALGLLTAAGLLFLAWGYGSIPALGELLSVSRSGLWRYRVFELKGRSLAGLKKPVTVTIDEFGVPHIFADDMMDLARAQGFLMASQRLFQMDLSTRMTAGRLSEWFGPRTEEIDDFFIRFGLRESAEKSLAHFEKDESTKAMLEAFVGGVNAFIEMRGRQIPEYKILGLTPERWTPLRVIHMAKQLTYNLAGRSAAVELTRIRSEIGIEKVLDLFPDRSIYEEVVYPMKGGSLRRRETAADHSFESRLKDVPPFRMPTPGNGSNNWAVDATRSTTGFSLMANDTHLGHSLPNVWYEAQLVTPQFNVYGVGLVAVPGLINGFNQDIAWGPTNGTTNVLDYFEVEFDGEKSNQHKNGDRFVPAEVRKEKRLSRGERTFEIDVVTTRLGPVIYRQGRYGLAARWTGHDTDNELLALSRLYDGRTIDDCLKAFTRWAAPIQNFICADKRDVAIAHQGKIPKRRPGEGRFIQNSQTAGPPDYIPESLRPRIVRPVNGVVSSANQRVVDDRYPYDLGWDYEEPFRGRRIHEKLQAQKKFSPDDFIQMQNDILDDQARVALPLLLAHLKGQEELGRDLSGWDFKVFAGDWRPAVYKEWFRETKSAIFSDEFTQPGRRFLPHDTRLIELLKNVTEKADHTDAQYVDNRTTKERETLSEVVTQALARALENLSKEQGPDYRSWRFDRLQPVNVPHVARLPGFGRKSLAMDGSANSIRGNQGWHGAVYKIVVAFGEWPEAFIQVPGGNEGDPLSPNYGRFVDDWAEGKMRKVQFYKDLDEAKARAVQVVEFFP